MATFPRVPPQRLAHKLPLEIVLRDEPAEHRQVQGPRCRAARARSAVPKEAQPVAALSRRGFELLGHALPVDAIGARFRGPREQGVIVRRPLAANDRGMDADDGQHTFTL